MATLTPDQLERLRAAEQYAKVDLSSLPGLNTAYSGGMPNSAFGGELYDAANQRAYAPVYTWSGGGGDGADPTATIAGYRGYTFAPGMFGDNSEMNGSQYDEYDAQGNRTGNGTWTGLADKNQFWTDALKAAAAMAAVYGAGTLAQGAGMGGGSGYGVAGGATEPVASIGAAGGMTEAELAAMGAAGAGGGAGGGAGLMSGAAKYLGPAATLLGGLAGAQGQKSEQTSERKTDPRVDPYLFGANGQPGLLQMTYDKLAGQMAPGGLQGYDDMQRVGKGLLNAPVAGNGFGLFGRYR